MNFIDRISYLSEKLLDRAGFVSKKKVKKYLIPAAKQSPYMVLADKTYAQLVDAYKSWVYTCIDKISKSVAKMPFKLYLYRNSTGSKIINCQGIKSSLSEIKGISQQKNYLKNQGITKVEIENHPYIDLMNRPNQIMTRFMIAYETMTRLELGGICGWYLVKDGLGIPREIWPMPLTQNGLLQPKIEADLTLSYWLYRDGEVNITFDPSELIIFKYPSPKSPFDWFSPLMAQTYPYDIDYYIQQQQANFYKNGVLPSMLAETDQDLQKDQVDEILNQLSEQYGSPSKAGKIMLLHSGLKQGNTYNARESLLDEVVRYAREKLITAYDLSEGKIGLVRDVNRANMEALNDTYIEDCLVPKTMLLEQVQEAFLLPLYDKGLMLDFVLPENTDKIYELQKADMEFRNYAILINEYREAQGKDPVPWGNVPWGPVGVMPLMTGSEPREPEPLPEEDNLENVPPEKGMLFKDIEPVSQWSKEKIRRVWQDKYNKRLKWIRLFENNLNIFFRMQKEKVLKKFDEHGKELFEKSFQYSHKAIKPSDIDLDRTEEIEELKGFFKNLYIKLMDESGNTLIQSLGLTSSFAIDKTAEKYLTSRLRLFSEEVTGTTFDDIQAILTAGYDEGMSYLDVKTILRQKFDAYEQYRAQLIVRTETNAAMNKAERLAIDQQGLAPYLKKHWLPSNNENSRETHQEAGVKYADGIPIEAMFEIGADTMDMPGNGSLPEENINCLCNVTYSRNDQPLA